MQEKDAIIKAKDEQIAQLKEAYDFLQTQVNALRRMIFGSKSERYPDPEHKQLSLLDENSFANADIQGSLIPEAEVTVGAYLRKKKIKTNKELPRQTELIKIPEAEMRCSCGACKKVIKTEVKELINYIPAVVEIIEQHREVAACPVCQEGVVTALAPLQILLKVGVSESFLAYSS